MLNPSVGRWMQEDPIRTEAGDTNLYRDVGNNPTNLTDPSGLLPKAPGEVEGSITKREDILGPRLNSIQHYYYSEPKFGFVACSPKSSPGGMRVSEALRGQETNHEATHA